MLLILCDGEFFDNTINALGPLWGEALSLVLFLFFADKVARMQWGQSNNFWDFGPIRVYLVDLKPFPCSQCQQL